MSVSALYANLLKAKRLENRKADSNFQKHQNITLTTPIYGKRLHDDVLHISKKPLRGELNGFLSICQAEASCISPKEY